MGRLDAESETLLPCVAPTIEAVDGRKWGSNQWVNNGKAIVQPIAWSEELTASIDLAGTIQRGGAGGRHDGVMQPIPIDMRNAGRDPEKHDEMNRQGVGVGEPGDPAHTVTSAFVNGVANGMAVRRLTPVECERLQGFPDNYTNIKDKCPDGPRYKALGNSWAVPVVRWIGERINAMA
jgi:DNA (cytosine-5)-methyltransferase 1